MCEKTKSLNDLEIPYQIRIDSDKIIAIVIIRGQGRSGWEQKLVQLGPHDKINLCFPDPLHTLIRSQVWGEGK